MPVINLNANQGVHLGAGTVPGLMHVYCVGPGPATFGISVYNAPPPYTWHQLAAGHMLAFQVDGFDAWVFNNGPSRVQLLVADLALDGEEAGALPGTEQLSAAI